VHVRYHALGRDEPVSGGAVIEGAEAMALFARTGAITRLEVTVGRERLTS
jgi:hypothetical protein